MYNDHANQSPATSLMIDGISQNILSQILDIIQSDVALYLQVY